MPRRGRSESSSADQQERAWPSSAQRPTKPWRTTATPPPTNPAITRLWLGPVSFRCLPDCARTGSPGRALPLQLGLLRGDLWPMPPTCRGSPTISGYACSLVPAPLSPLERLSLPARVALWLAKPDHSPRNCPCAESACTANHYPRCVLHGSLEPAVWVPCSATAARPFASTPGPHAGTVPSNPCTLPLCSWGSAPTPASNPPRPLPTSSA
mmetsp:Transcript_2527/g.6371  ORF Transcript_2527/g.6371 Transcript_2527/m.6371 type:complete len:211 (-) Transcript_2527:594-1226(-)